MKTIKKDTFSFIKECIEKRGNKFIDLLKKKLRFDFFLPIKNICIEYDGKQHFEPINFFYGGIANFKKQIQRDILKNNLDKCLL